MNNLKHIEKNLKFIIKKEVPHKHFSKIVNIFAGKRKKYYIFNLYNYERSLIRTIKLLTTLKLDHMRIMALSEFNFSYPFINKNIYQYREKWSPGLFLRALKDPKKENLYQLPHLLLSYSNISDNTMAIKEAKKLNILTFTFTQIDNELYYNSDFSIAVNHNIRNHSKLFYVYIMSKILHSPFYRSFFFKNALYKNIKKVVESNKLRIVKRPLILNAALFSNKLNRKPKFKRLVKSRKKVKKNEKQKIYKKNYKNKTRRSHN